MGPENEDCVGDTSADEKLNELQADESSSEDQEEALSLSDLPINHNNNALHDHSSVPPAADFFEFFTTSYSDMCPADDIILSGKLLPLKQTYQISSPPFDYLAKQNTRCKRSESLSELNSTAQYSNSIKSRAVRSSRSLDDRRRHRRSHSNFVSDQLDRNCSKVPKSRWQLLISGIGMVRFPPEMVLRDIKNRQSRRSNPSTLLPGSEAKSPAAIGSNNGSSWGLIKALSCKDHTSISVTTSFVCMPHI